MKTVKKTGFSIHFLVALVFIVSGVVVILKLLGMESLPIPEEVLIWVTAIGSALGGLHIIYIKVKHKAIKSFL